MNNDDNNTVSYHVLFHCYCVSIHIYSYDLLKWNNDWKQQEWCFVNTTNNIYNLTRRERPSIAFETDSNGNIKAKYLFNAVEALNGTYFNFVAPL